MSNIPLIAELGAKADIFQELLNTTQIPENIQSTLQPMAKPSDMFTMADSRVFVRTRPIIPFDQQPMTHVGIVQKVEGYKDAVLMAPKVSLSGKCSIEPSRVVLDGIFVGKKDTTEVIYQAACAPLLALSISGASTCVLCYGQTGSGKTYTTSGLMQLFANDIEPCLATHDISLVVIEVQSAATIDLLSGTPIQMGEDLQGEIKLLGATEHPIVNCKAFLSYISDAAAARSTKATGRNEVSSRSHMITRVRFTPKGSSWARPGFLFVADLAGSESTADSATHDKSRQLEAKFINSSLMTLKDCIRARAAGGSAGNKHLHIPFRRSPLTMMLRDCFELAVRRPTKTVVIACTSPLLRDARHTINTLRYASLLAVTPPATVVACSADDPNGFDRPTALAFLTRISKGRITAPELVLPEGDGRALVQIPEAEFIARVLATHSATIGEKGAQMIYTHMWGVVVDARTKTRQALKGDSKKAFKRQQEENGNDDNDATGKDESEPSRPPPFRARPNPNPIIPRTNAAAPPPPSHHQGHAVPPPHRSTSISASTTSGARPLRSTSGGVSSSSARPSHHLTSHNTANSSNNSNAVAATVSNIHHPPAVTRGSVGRGGGGGGLSVGGVMPQSLSSSPSASHSGGANNIGSARVSVGGGIRSGVHSSTPSSTRTTTTTTTGQNTAAGGGGNITPRRTLGGSGAMAGHHQHNPNDNSNTTSTLRGGGGGGGGVAKVGHSLYTSASTSTATSRINDHQHNNSNSHAFQKPSSSASVANTKKAPMQPIIKPRASPPPQQQQPAPQPKRPSASSSNPANWRAEREAGWVFE